MFVLYFQLRILRTTQSKYPTQPLSDHREVKEQQPYCLCRWTCTGRAWHLARPKSQCCLLAAYWAGKMPALPVHPCLFILLHSLAYKQLKHLSLNFPLTSLNFPQLFLISPTYLHSLYAKVELYDSNLVYLCAIIKN